MGVYAVPSADAVLAARDEDSDALRTEHSEHAAQGPRIIRREIPLGFTVWYDDCQRGRLFFEYVAEPLEVYVRNDWPSVAIPLRIATDAVEDKRSWVCHGCSVLYAHVRVATGIVRVVPAAVPLDDGELCA